MIEVTDRDRKLIDATVETVHRRHSHRQAFWNILSALATVTVVALPITLVLNHATGEAQRANAHTNCVQFQALAAIQADTFAAQVEASKRFADTSTSTFGLTKEEFDQLVRDGEARDRRQLDALKKLAATNCSTAIK